MPVEINRKTHVQWIVPLQIAMHVIDEITFIDPQEQFQQYTFKFNNPATSADPSADPKNSTRKTHVIGFAPSDTDPAPTDSSSASFKVEVIDEAKVIIPEENNQEYWYTFRSDKNPPKHLKTHVTRIINNLADFPIPDTVDNLLAGGQNTIAVERIDEISFIDPMNRYQETIYKLDWEKEAENDQKLVIPQAEFDYLQNNAPGPFRLDPFQNIIGVNTKQALGLTHAYITGDLVIGFQTPSGGEYSYAMDVGGFGIGGSHRKPPGHIAYPPFGYWPYNFTLDPNDLDSTHYKFDNQQFPFIPLAPYPAPRRSYDTKTPVPRSFRISTDQTVFFCDIYPSTAATIVEKGSSYESHLGEAFNSFEEVNAGGDPSAGGATIGAYHFQTSIYWEFSQHWVVLKIDT